MMPHQGNPYERGFGRRMQAARRKLGLSVEDLAQRVGDTLRDSGFDERDIPKVQHYKGWERGQFWRSGPGLLYYAPAMTIAKTLGTTLVELMPKERRGARET